jgi:UDP-2-acetamido-3-amino-2,3-dideoxy-glucuronate N-acetyltransferase
VYLRWQAWLFDGARRIILAPPADTTIAEESFSPVMSTPQSPQIAVLGCGHWGKNLIRNFHYLGHLTMACDLNRESLAAVHQQFPEVLVTTQLADVLANPSIAGVVVATPSATHFSICQQVLQAGKHCYVEKPMATRADDTQTLLDLAKATDRVLMVGHLLLYHPAVYRLQTLIADGELGDIKYIQSDRLNFNPNRQDANVLWDLAPHDLSMIGSVLQANPVQVLSASGQRTGADNRVDVAHLEVLFQSIQYPNRQWTAHIHNSWIHPFKQVKLLVRGSLKTAVIDDTLPDNKLQIFTPPTAPTASNGLASAPLNQYLSIEPLKLECQHFIHCIKTGQTPKTDGLNGYHVVNVLEAAEKLLANV